ncbi:hypothetical protein [Paracidobacterium acidisoli]|uniref:Uncharacterized protein n=1 Tax=Paracidobacterium acidisoli TaxID=2303751 RepID=A0A372IP48_9BACT|nr:hypothetical protein [Paracidobacterium acidisoli]MBT9331015.1 hypothetical protein [Paracidobacterium acidisoli]
MTDQGCGQGSAGAHMAENAAMELYQIAALMLGNETEALGLVEETIAGVEIDPCADASAAGEIAQQRLISVAIRRMDEQNPKAFVPAPAEAGPAGCIQEDDIAAAGLSTENMAELISGSGRDRLRAWLDQLPLAQRVIFVQRAVLGRDNARTAYTMDESLPASRGWSAEQVSQLFRQALCSLANSLVHAASMA